MRQLAKEAALAQESDEVFAAEVKKGPGRPKGKGKVQAGARAKAKGAKVKVGVGEKQEELNRNNLRRKQAITQTI